MDIKLRQLGHRRTSDGFLQALSHGNPVTLPPTMVGVQLGDLVNPREFTRHDSPLRVSPDRHWQVIEGFEVPLMKGAARRSHDGAKGGTPHGPFCEEGVPQKETGR